MTAPTPLNMPRRLRFPYEMRENESVVGALASATREHVLATTTVALREACIPPTNRRGTLQIGEENELRRLAYVLRCDADALLANVGVRIGSENARPNHQGVAFGDLIQRWLGLSEQARGLDKWITAG